MTAASGKTGVSVALLCMMLSACAQPASPQAGCERQVDSAPEVRDLRLKAAGSPTFLLEHQDELREATRRAELACLRSRGLAPPGGVEAPRRPNSLFNGLGI